jgi:segregation and condensation protein A
VRGCPEGLRVDKSAEWTCNLFDLLSAYGRVKARTAPVLHQVSRRPVWTLEQAVARLSLMIGDVPDWRELSAFLPRVADADYARSAMASTFVAALELARTGRLELSQEVAFAPLSLRPAI